MAYDKSFYEEQSLGSRNSAKEVIPYLLQQFKIDSVVDLGCGIGTWLAVFAENGVTDFLGCDGSYVPQGYLQIPQSSFRAVDLSQSLEFERRYSLAMSMEVAEHIAPESAEAFVKKLTELSDIVLFSAALPYQGGTGHVNENLPEYWALLFRKYDYVPLDIIRDNFWLNGMVCPWYRQNTIVYIKKSLWQESYSHLPMADRQVLTRIHPEMYFWGAIRLKDGDMAPIAFERDKSNFYAVTTAWQKIYDMPEKLFYYGEEFNIEYSELSWIRRNILKLKYFLGKIKK